MKMPTSSYFTAFQSARALWKWIRRRHDEDEVTAEQQQRLALALTQNLAAAILDEAALRPPA